MTKIQIVIPCINLWSKYTKNCINSIKTKYEYRILLIDNGSTDETKEEMKEQGYVYRKPLDRDYKTTIESKDLADHIKDVGDDFVNEIIACPNNGHELTQCTSAYKIMPEELSFLKRHNIALPRYCPNCRHYARLAQRNPLKLWHRVCMKPGCTNTFETSYAPERPEIIYCERCYQQEVY